MSDTPMPMRRKALEHWRSYAQRLKHRVVELERELSAARRELAQARELLYEYFAAYPHGRLGEKYRALKSPAQGATSTAPQEGLSDPKGIATGVQSAGTQAPVAPAAAVPDDPVAVYDANFIADSGERIVGLHSRPFVAVAHLRACRTLAAHYMRKAANIGALKGAGREAVEAILAAAAELERKP